MSNWRLMVGALMIVILAAFGFACGSDDDDGGNGDEPEATEVMDDEEPGNGEEPSNGDVPSGGGGGTLTIGDQTWELSVQFCGFSPEETENDRVSFTLFGSGQTADGEQGTIDATIQDTDEQGRYSGDGTIQSITISNWEGTTGFLGEPDWLIEVDGKNVSADATFDDTSTDTEIEEVPGTLEATCP